MTRIGFEEWKKRPAPAGTFDWIAEHVPRDATVLAAKPPSVRLREWRQHFGMSQGQLAGRLGIHRDAISHYESGRRELRVDRLADIAKLFGITMEQLLELPPASA